MLFNQSLSFERNQGESFSTEALETLYDSLCCICKKEPSLRESKSAVFVIPVKHILGTCSSQRRESFEKKKSMLTCFTAEFLQAWNERFLFDVTREMSNALHSSPDRQKKNLSDGMYSTHQCESMRPLTRDGASTCQCLSNAPPVHSNIFYLFVSAVSPAEINRTLG